MSGKEVALGIVIALCVTGGICFLILQGFNHANNNGNRANEIGLTCIKVGGIVLDTEKGPVCVWSQKPV